MNNIVKLVVAWQLVSYLFYLMKLTVYEINVTDTLLFPLYRTIVKCPMHIINLTVWQNIIAEGNKMDLLELWAIFGPGVAGAVFGAGWWIWLDAVVCSTVTVPFLHYLPGKCSISHFISLSLSLLGLGFILIWSCFFIKGIFASLAALMFNCVRKEDIDYSPYDEGEWRYLISCLFLLSTFNQFQIQINHSIFEALN